MWGRLIALVVPLGIDTFVVAAALGLQGLSGRPQVRISALFAGFEGGMPLVGLVAGRPLGTALGSGADYAAVGVLIAFGLFTLLHDSDEGADVARLAAARGRAAVVLGMSVSIDELAIGFTLGLLHLPFVVVLVAIAVQAAVVSQLGLHLGGRLSEGFRGAAEKLSGLVLVGLGVSVLVERIAT